MTDVVYSQSFPPAQAGIAEASKFLDDVFCKSAELSVWLSTLAPSLHVILDEICSNIVKHSNASSFELHVEIDVSPPGVKMTFVDDGVEYDPLTHADPDTTLPAEERSVGGLGIFMVKKMASSVSYRRANGRNFLVVERTALTGNQRNMV